MKRKVKLKDIMQDPKLLALRTVNEFFVSRYRQAYRNGVNMPLMVVDSKGYIVSGNHRYEALLREYGEDFEITVIVMTFKTQRKRLEFFAQENAAHGNAMDGYTRKKIAFELMDTGATENDIAQLFNVSVSQVIDWGGHSALLIIGNKQTRVPLKRGVHVTPGQTVTQQQLNEHQSHVGKNVFALANQITQYLNNDWVKKTDINIDSLQELADTFVAWRP